LTAKSASALGHMGLLLGLLAVILELNQIAVESSPMAGTADSAFYAAVMVWLVAFVLVVNEWEQARRSP
jgi:hypothetical protein